MSLGGTNGTSPLASVSFSSNGDATLTTVESGGIEVVTGISCQNGQLVVTKARLGINYTPPVLSTTTTTLSLSGAGPYLTDVTPTTANVLRQQDLVSDKLAVSFSKTTTDLALETVVKKTDVVMGDIQTVEPTIETEQSNAVTLSQSGSGEGSEGGAE